MAQLPLKEEDFDTSSAITSEEILALGQSGWTKYDQATFNGTIYHFYRRPKRFGSLRNMKDKSQIDGISNYSQGSGDVSRNIPPFSLVWQKNDKEMNTC